MDNLKQNAIDLTGFTLPAQLAVMVGDAFGIPNAVWVAAATVVSFLGSKLAARIRAKK